MTRKQHVMAAVCVAVLLAGCGGGGKKGKGATTTPAAPAPAPTGSVTIALSSAPIAQSLDYGDDYSTTLDGTWTGTNLGNAAVYLQVVDSGNLFTLPAVQPAPTGNGYRYTVALPTNAQAGDRTGTLTVRACRDAACAQPFANASASISYRVQIAAVGEWETIQRDATHNGYVPVRLDPTRFAKAWEWNFPKDAAAVDAFVLRPSTGSGAVYAVAGNRSASSSDYGVALYALDENTGNVRWSYPLPLQGSVRAPGATAGLVYVPTVDSDTLLTAVDAGNGTLRFKYAQSTLPTATGVAPTTFGGNAYFFAGSNGGEIHAANAVSGERRWSTPRAGTPNGIALAADQSFIYYYGNSALQVLERSTGNVVAAIADPSADGSNFSGSGATVLGSRSNAIVNSNNNTTRIHKLTSFNLVNRRWEWSSQFSYRPLFAVANGVIYALRRDTSGPVLDALDEASGNILWSWQPNIADGQAYTINNVVATKNLVFVSTEPTSGAGRLYAIDIATRQAVWSYPEGGYPVISANRTLYLLAGLGSLPSKRIVAIKLR